MANETRDPNKSEKKYEPRDAAFYPMAACMLTAALRPRGSDPHDVESAKRAGHACARVLDRGVVPDKFILPSTARILSIIDRKEQLTAATEGRPLPGARYAVGITEGEKAKERARLDALGPTPSRDEAMGQNAKRIEQLADISEGVRLTALFSAYGRILTHTDVTGARETEAIAIVIEEIENAIDAHRDAGNPLRNIENEPPGPNGSRHVPYPGSLVVELMVASAVANEEEEAAAEAATAPGARP